jgi:hypothetical protein
MEPVTKSSVDKVQFLALIATKLAHAQSEDKLEELRRALREMQGRLLREQPYSSRKSFRNSTGSRLSRQRQRQQQQ